MEMTAQDRQKIEELIKQTSETNSLVQAIHYKVAGGGPMNETGLLQRQDNDDKFQRETLSALEKITQHLDNHSTRIEKLENKKPKLWHFGATSAGAGGLGLFGSEIVEFFKTIFNIRP